MRSSWYCRIRNTIILLAILRRRTKSFANFCAIESLQMREGPHPVLRHRGMSLAGLVLSEKYIARCESPLRAVADTDLDSAGKRNTPLSSRRRMPTVQIVAIHIVLENEHFNGNIC